METVDEKSHKAKNVDLYYEIGSMVRLRVADVVFSKEECSEASAVAVTGPVKDRDVKTSNVVPMLVVVSVAFVGLGVMQLQGAMNEPGLGVDSWWQ